MASTSENTRKWLNETATAGSTSAVMLRLKQSYSPNPDVLCPTVIAHELVGVQPHDRSRSNPH